MDHIHSQLVLGQLLRNEIGPIEAADELDAAGHFAVGLDTEAEDMSEEQVTRFQAMLGRLWWHALRRSGVADIEEPKTVAACLAYFDSSQASIDEDSVDRPASGGTA